MGSKAQVVPKAPTRFPGVDLSGAAARDTTNDYIERITKVVNENAKGEFSEKKKLYETLVQDKKDIEKTIRTNNRELVVDSARLQKQEEDIQIWKNSIYNTNQKIEFLDEDILGKEDELDCLKRKVTNKQDELDCLENKRLELSLDKRSFGGIVQEKSAKSRILKQRIQQKQDKIDQSIQKVDSIKTQIDNVFKSKVSLVPDLDPFLSHLDKQIAQKTGELECPVCFCVCQPPILSCPKFHLVCAECWPRMSVCGECRTPYEGQMRHRYAEREHQEMQELVRVREEHKKSKNLTMSK